MIARNINVFIFLTTVCLIQSFECAKPSDKLGHLTMLMDTYRICSGAKSLIPCLKARSLLILDKLTKDDDSIPLIWNSLSLVKDPEVRTGNRMLPALTQEELEASLPKEEAARDKTLDHLLLNALSKFVKSRTLQFRLPELALNTIQKNFEEGRKKGGKGDGAMMGMMMMGGTLMSLGFAGLAAMAGKALMVSMMALMLSAIVAAKKGGGDGHSATYEVVQVPSHSHSHSHAYHHGRSLEGDSPSATDLPYRAYSSYAAPDINALQAS